MGSSFFKMFRGNRQQDPMEDPKAAHVFLDSLPKNDPLGLLEAIVAMLEDRGAGMTLMSSNRCGTIQTLASAVRAKRPLKIWSHDSIGLTRS